MTNAMHGTAPTVSAAAAVAMGGADLPALYNHWFPDVLRWARALGGQERDLEDIAQEVFLVVRKRIDAFDGRNPAGWLYQITRRKVKDFRQQAWIRRVFTQHRIDAFDDLPDDGDGPASVLERKQRRRLLYLILSRMTEVRRATFTLFEIDGLSGEDIARIQGVPVNTVWSRLLKARKQFIALAARYLNGQDSASAGQGAHGSETER